MPFQSTTITTTTPATIITPIANFFNDLIWLIIANTSVTGVRVDISASGSAVCSLWIQPTSTLKVFLPGPIPTGAVNTAWIATLSAPVTDIRIFASYYSHL